MKQLLYREHSIPQFVFYWVLGPQSFLPESHHVSPVVIRVPVQANKIK